MYTVQVGKIDYCYYDTILRMTLFHYSYYYYVIICHILSSIIPAHCCIYVVNVYNICFLYLCYTPYGVIILRINYCHCHCHCHTITLNIGLQAIDIKNLHEIHGKCLYFIKSLNKQDLHTIYGALLSVVSQSYCNTYTYTNPLDVRKYFKTHESMRSALPFPL